MAAAAIKAAQLAKLYTDADARGGWDAGKVTEGVFVGSLAAAVDAEGLKDNGVTHVLTSASRLSVNVPEGVTHLQLDADDHPIVVASYAGAPGHPSWFLNLEDHEANPEVIIRIQEREYTSEPEILDGEKYQAVWDELVEDRPFYRDYQALTERRIPLIRLREKLPA